MDEKDARKKPMNNVLGFVRAMMPLFGDILPGSRATSFLLVRPERINE